jgi:hypothetical protein
MTPPAPEKTCTLPNGCPRMWATKRLQYSADRPHPDESTALLAGATTLEGTGDGRPVENGQFCTTSGLKNIDSHSRTQKKKIAYTLSKKGAKEFYGIS